MGTPDQRRVVRKRDRIREEAGRRAVRAYRRLLGLCYGCLQPSLPGLTRCEVHHREHLATDRRAQEQKKRRQGFRMMRVPIKEVD